MENNKYGDDLYLDLLERYKEVRKSNVKLLAEKRELLLRTQEVQRTELELRRTDGIGLKRKTEDKARKVNTMDNISGTTNVEDRKVDTDKECETRTELKSICTCESIARLREVIKVNHQWQDAYSRLLERCKKLESNQQNLQEEVRKEREDNSTLRELVSKPPADIENVAQPEYKRSKSLKDAGCSADDFEALKHQLLAYQEDFHCERKEKEKSDTKNKEYKLKIRQADEIIQTMSQENQRYKHCYNRVNQEKEHLVSELRRISTGSLPMYPAACNSRRQQHFSYPPTSSEDIIPRQQARPILHQLPSNAFQGGNVVRDTASSI